MTAPGSLVLRPPGPDDEAAVRALHQEMLADDFEFVLADGTWDEVLATLRREASGVDLPAGRVSADFLLAEVKGTVVGRVSIRHALTPFLLEVGGHVGYGVGRAYRRRGYATEILRQSVRRLADLGVNRVLVTCDDDNVGSAAVIEACGGLLEDVRKRADGPAKRRYWISTERAVPAG